MSCLIKEILLHSECANSIFDRPGGLPMYLPCPLAYLIRCQKESRLSTSRSKRLPFPRLSSTLSIFLSLTVCSPSKILALKTVPEVFKFSSNCWMENSDNLFDCSKHPTILTGLRCRTNFSSNTFRSILSHKIVSIVSSSSSS